MSSSKAVGYVRISDKDQSHNSIETQTEDIKEYCERNGLQLSEIFTDNGKSAFTFERPEWRQLETFVKKHKDVRFLIIYHIDRFSRANLMDALVKINELETKLNVKVLTVKDPVNLDSEDLGVQIIRTIELLFSNNERRRIVSRTNDGIYRSLASGRYCSSAPVGYKNSKSTDGKPLLEIDREKAPVVEFIYKSYINGLEIEEIRKLAREKGYKQTGHSSVRRILENFLYAGLVRVPARKGVPAQIIPAIHAPIISEHDYWLVQKRLNSKFITVQRSEDVPLRGVLHCHCGALMTAGNSKSRSGKYYWYYLCGTHKKNFSATRLHYQFYEILEHFSFDGARIEWYRSKIVEAIENKLNNKGGELMRAKLELSKIQTKINNTQEKFLLQPDISSAVYSKVMIDLKAEEASIQKVLVQLSSTGQSLYDTINEILPKLVNVRELFMALPLTQQHLFINKIFGYSLTYKDGIYRTASIYPTFADKELILKEKGLLIIDQKPYAGYVTPVSTRERN